MYNLPLSNPILEQAFKNQLLVTYVVLQRFAGRSSPLIRSRTPSRDKLFKSDTLVLYVHDM